MLELVCVRQQLLYSPPTHKPYRKRGRLSAGASGGRTGSRRRYALRERCHRGRLAAVQTPSPVSTAETGILEQGLGPATKAQLISRVQHAHPEFDASVVSAAYDYAQHKHAAQTRASGDPYFTHPVRVAIYLAEKRLDPATVATAVGAASSLPTTLCAARLAAGPSLAPGRRCRRRLGLGRLHVRLGQLRLGRLRPSLDTGRR